MSNKCKKCDIQCICPICDNNKINMPLVIKYIDKEMPIIIHTCAICHVELFRSMTFENITLNKSFCLMCSILLETK
jgi:hypothetical protein